MTLHPVRSVLFALTGFALGSWGFMLGQSVREPAPQIPQIDLRKAPADLPSVLAIDRAEALRLTPPQKERILRLREKMVTDFGRAEAKKWAEAVDLAQKQEDGRALLTDTGRELWFVRRAAYEPMYGQDLMAQKKILDKGQYAKLLTLRHDQGQSDERKSFTILFEPKTADALDLTERQRRQFGLLQAKFRSQLETTLGAARSEKPNAQRDASIRWFVSIESFSETVSYLTPTQRLALYGILRERLYVQR